jgi:hypothetical protein
MAEKPSGGLSGPPRWTILGKQDKGAWSIPKENTRTAKSHSKTAEREFLEETGFAQRGVPGTGPVKLPKRGLCRQYASMQLLFLRESGYMSLDMRWLSFSESLTILGS